MLWIILFTEDNQMIFNKIRECNNVSSGTMNQPFGKIVLKGKKLESVLPEDTP